MPDDASQAVRSAYRTLGRHASGFRFEPGNVLYRLSVPDYVSLVALFVAWVSALLFLSGESNLAVLLTFVAFGFDKLDGYLARRLGTSSAFGRQIDSFIDVFVYLVSGVLLFHYELAPGPKPVALAVTAVVGFFVLAFGGLRLVRHNEEGFIEDEEGTNNYHGTTVVHTNAVVVLNYLCALFLAPVGLWNGWVAAATVAAACPLMVSDYHSPKTERIHWLLGAGCAVVSVVLVWVEFGP
jgi:CDP-diacylglycerol--serine O-phosphatidyltransferase